MNAPTCFLSYSWDDAAHKQWVLRIAIALQNSGVHTHLDQWDVNPGMDLPRYMETCVRESQFVLLVCTPTFAGKANGGKGGVGYEKSIVTGEIFNSAPREAKFVPILRAGIPEQSIPSYLKSRVFVDFREDDKFQNGMEELLRHMHGVPAVTRPNLGERPRFGSNEVSAPAAPLPVQLTQAHAAMATPVIASSDRPGLKSLMNFAYSSDGLNLTKQGAIDWAEERVSTTFNLDRYKALMNFAYSSDGLNLTKQGAIDWAEERVFTTFDLDRYKGLMNFAYSGDGLNLTKQGAIDWAEERVFTTFKLD